MIQPFTVVKLCWIALGLYWLAGAFGTKKTAVHEHSGLRVFRLALLSIILVLLFTNWLRIGPLGLRLFRWHSAAAWLGAALCCLGVLLAVWARRTLAGNWSDKVALKVDHELVERGPYRFVRHPIYTGVLLAIAGAGITIGEWRGFVALLMMSANYWVKAGREEAILASHFGEKFRDYKRRTGFLLPGL